MGVGREAHLDRTSLTVMHAALHVMHTDGGRLGSQVMSFVSFLLASVGFVVGVGRT